ncbi:CoA pyrophosphatase [Parashewanella curva]|uniref:CoA pyrophosphatase n=1 Tax=Parashewanella curva TaxID=2338552 RepID=A0A3L8PWW7_9GAMM|nr:CoA pyrophosphatase [Parashewanella curva]RLV59864.1 CoA pyrophosphatase [Parashewanella curva]
MDLAQFKERFNLSPQPQNADRFCVPRQVASTIEYRDSAVLIPIVEINNQLEVLLTQRPLYLKHHPGQICFPGGKVAEGDTTLEDTALRELHEELGVIPDRIKVLGQLPIQHTYTQFQITPIVGVLDNLENLTIDSNEVADHFTVPLTQLSHPSNQQSIKVKRRNIEIEVLMINAQQRLIWGVTASIIHTLQQKVGLNVI